VHLPGHTDGPDAAADLSGQFAHNVGRRVEQRLDILLGAPGRTRQVRAMLARRRR